ncbi:MAG: choice-of-anchor D domain-containing protein [Ignavibacteria bacterium]|nr:choice-of-anchor D domain-containing protein [Ignavibacteria bacterium]
MRFASIPTRFLFILIFGILLVSPVIAQTSYWEKLAGFPSAHTGDPLSVTSILVTSKSTYIVCTNTGSGVYRSDTRGAAWKTASPFANYDHGYAVCVNPSGDLFVATNNTTGGKDRTSFSRSTDDGITYTKSKFYPDSIFISSLACSPSGTIFIGTTKHGIYRMDNDSTFVPTTFAAKNNVVSSLMITKSGTIIAGTTENGIFQSTDNGETWTLLTDEITIRNIACLYQDQAGTIYTGTNYGAYRSKDEGKTWEEILNTGFGSSTVTSFVASPNGKLYAGVKGEGVYYSPDNGISWTQITSGLASTSVTAIGIDSLSNFLVGTSEDMYRNTLAPVLSVRNLELDFGTIKTSSTKDSTVVITNIGGSPLGIASMKISGADASSFKVVMTDSVTIEPNTSKPFTVSCSSSTNGEKEATLEFTSNTTGRTTEITLRAIVSGSISVEESTNSLFSAEIFPNPIRTTASVTINSTVTSIGEIRLVSLLGTPVTTSEFSIVSGTPLNLNISLPDHVASGMYSAVITIGGNILSVPLSVIR